MPFRLFEAVGVVTADTKPMEKALDEAKAKVQGFSASMGRMALAAKIAWGVAAASAGFGLKMAADAEQSKIAFEVMLGSAQKAVALFDQLKKFAAVTPFELTDLINATRTLLNFGIAGERVMDVLAMISDVASGNAETLGRLALVYGQVAAMGRLQGQDLIQLVNAGFNPLQQIAARTGETMAQLKKRMEEGRVSLAEVQQAFRDATSEGGRFYQMNLRQSQTLAGRISTLKDNFAELARALGEALLPAASSAVTMLTRVANIFAGLSEHTKTTLGYIIGIATAGTGLIWVLTKVMAVLRGIVSTVKQVVRSLVVMKALLGPGGLAALATGLIAAGVALAATNRLLRSVDQSAENAAESADKMGNATVAAANKAADAVAKMAKQVRESTKSMQMLEWGIGPLPGVNPNDVWAKKVMGLFAEQAESLRQRLGTFGLSEDEAKRLGLRAMGVSEGLLKQLEEAEKALKQLDEASVITSRSRMEILGEHRRDMDTLNELLRAGKITPAVHEAAARKLKESADQKWLEATEWAKELTEQEIERRERVREMAREQRERARREAQSWGGSLSLESEFRRTLAARIFGLGQEQATREREKIEMLRRIGNIGDKTYRLLDERLRLRFGLA